MYHNFTIFGANKRAAPLALGTTRLSIKHIFGPSLFCLELSVDRKNEKAVSKAEAHNHNLGIQLSRNRDLPLDKTYEMRYY